VAGVRVVRDKVCQLCVKHPATPSQAPHTPLEIHDWQGLCLCAL
jgi:hypothetical protein